MITQAVITQTVITQTVITQTVITQTVITQTVITQTVITQTVISYRMLKGFSISTRRTVPNPARAHISRAVCSGKPQVPRPAPPSASEVVMQNSTLTP